jgi:hypothetical protein
MEDWMEGDFDPRAEWGRGQHPDDEDFERDQRARERAQHYYSDEDRAADDPPACTDFDDHRSE